MQQLITKGLALYQSLGSVEYVFFEDYRGGATPLALLLHVRPNMCVHWCRSEDLLEGIQAGWQWACTPQATYIF